MSSERGDGTRYGRAEWAKAVVLPTWELDAGGDAPATGYGVAEGVRAVVLPATEVVGSADVARARLAEIAGSFASTLASIPHEGRPAALVEFFGAARREVASFDPETAQLLVGKPAANG